MRLTAALLFGAWAWESSAVRARRLFSFFPDHSKIYAVTLCVVAAPFFLLQSPVAIEYDLQVFNAYTRAEVDADDDGVELSWKTGGHRYPRLAEPHRPSTLRLVQLEPYAVEQNVNSWTVNGYVITLVAPPPPRRARNPPRYTVFRDTG